MQVNISKFFINNSVFLIALTFSFLIAGIFSYINLNRNEDPGFKIRTASIITDADSYSAYAVDRGVTRPIEEAINVMEEIEDIKSESYQGRSVIYADLYEYYSNIQPVWDRLRRKTEGAKALIYDGLNPVVNDEYGDVFGALIGISKEGASYEELYDITKNIKNDFFKIKSRGRVEIFGLQDEAVYFNFKSSYLSNLKLTPDYLKSFTDSLNQIKTGGIIYTDNDTVEVNSKNNFADINGIKSRLINIKGVPIAFEDIFNVEKTIKKPVSKLMKSNGKNALIIGISLKKDGNILNWGKEIKNEIRKMKEKYKGVNIEILSLQSDYVKYLTDKFLEGLIESILVVIFVVFLILGLKAGLITGGIIIVTIFSTFFAMKILNIGLDKISLSALIISLGILVDNSIVVAQGALTKEFDTFEARKDFIIKTAGKFQMPLLIVTLTTSLAFFPVFIAKSTVGEYASNLFKVVFITLIFSWFYSVSLLPYLLLKFLSDTGAGAKKFKPAEFLKSKIKYALNAPKLSVILAIAAFLVSVILFSFVPKIFFPDSDRNAYEIRLNLKNGVSFNKTKEAVEIVEDYLKTKKNVTSYSSYIGTSAPRYVLSAAPEADKLNFGMLLINVKDYKSVDDDILEAKKFINKNIKNVQAVVRKIPLGPPIDAPVEIRIINNDINRLFYFQKQISDELQKIEGVYLIKNNWGDFIPSYDIKISDNAAIMAGISPKYLFDYLNTVYNGEILTYYFRENIKIPVILKADDDFLKNSENLKSISIYSSYKNSIIPIAQIADIKEKYTYPKILRRNNAYVLTVQAWVNDITSSEVINKMLPVLDKIEGLNYEIGGEWEKSKKGNKSVIEKVSTAFLLIFLILIAAFNDIKKPLMIAFCAILALAGANFGMFVTMSAFGFITFLGYISLVGICMNNGVILLNEISGCSKDEITNAAKSRVEPVLLTCLTTVGGMLPLWIKNDPMFSTLAVCIIFGLLFSVVITLFVLPSLFYIICSKNVNKSK